MRRELENVELARAGAEEIDEQQLRALLPALARSCRRPTFRPQYPCQEAQSHLLTPLPRDLTLSSDLRRQAGKWVHRYIPQIKQTAKLFIKEDGLRRSQM